MTRLVRTLIVVALLGLNSSAHAEPIRFEFTGTLTTVDDTLGFLAALSINTGDAISGHFTYDTDDTLTEINPDKGSGNVRVQLTVTVHSGIGDYTATKTGMLLVNIYNDHPTLGAYMEILGPQAIFDPAIAGTYLPLPNQNLNLSIVDASNTHFSDHTLLPSSFNLAGQVAKVDLSAWLGNEGGFLGSYYMLGTMDTLVAIPDTTFLDGFESE